MKQIFPALGLLALGTVTAMSSLGKEVKFQSFRSAPRQSVTIPATPDSADNVKSFDKASLLESKKAAGYFNRLETQDWTTLVPDSAGVYDIPSSTSERKGEITVLSSRIKSPRFAKGKLKASSSAMMEVFVDGKSKIKKTTSDSIPSEKSADIQLDPEATAEIEVHILALPDDKSAPKFSLSFIPDKEYENLEIAAGPDVERRFTINTTTLGGRLASTSVSPDGKYVMLRFSETYGEKDTRYWSELRETASGRVVDAFPPEGASWMPRGSELYFTRRSGAGYDLFTAAPGGNPTLKAKDIPVASSQIIWAPDATWFAYYTEEEGTKENGVMRRVKNPDDRIPGNRDRSYLSRYDLATGLSSPLTYGGPTTYIRDISPDSKKILYTATREIPGKFPFYNISLVEMDVNTLSCDTIVSNTGGLNGAEYSPDGKELLIWGGPNEFDGIGRNAGNHEWANDFDVQLYLMELATRKVTPLTRDFNPSVEDTPVWNRADGRIYFVAADGFYDRLYALDPVKGNITELPVKVDYVRNFSIGDRESRWLSYCGMSYEHMGSGYLLDLKSGRNQLLADPMGDELSSIDFGESFSWTFTSEGGDTIDGTVTLPPDFDPQKKYPLIVYYYSGTTPSTRTSHSPYTPQLFASRDYVVYVINPSGTIGYGQEFSARHVNAWGEKTADEIIEGVKKFCKAHPFVDDKKIGCIGASYGGFMTQLLQTKTDIFAAAVSHAGISNVTSYWGEGYWGYSYNSVAAARSYPWTDPELFTKRGSLFNADKIHTPLLLLHGTRDTNVPIGESIQLFNALKILGRQVEFITVEDQDHIITDFEKRKLWHATIMAWFAKWLQDDPLWWNSLYKD